MNYPQAVPDFLFDEEGNTYRVFRSGQSEWQTDAPELRHTSPGHWATVPLFRIAEIPGVTVLVENAAGQDITEDVMAEIPEQVSGDVDPMPTGVTCIYGEDGDGRSIETLCFENSDGTNMAVRASSVVAMESIYGPDDDSIIKVYFAVGGESFTAEIEDIEEGELDSLFETMHARWLESMPG